MFKFLDLLVNVVIDIGLSRALAKFTVISYFVLEIQRLLD